MQVVGERDVRRERAARAVVTGVEVGVTSVGVFQFGIVALGRVVNGKAQIVGPIGILFIGVANLRSIVPVIACFVNLCVVAGHVESEHHRTVVIHLPLEFLAVFEQRADVVVRCGLTRW